MGSATVDLSVLKGADVANCRASHNSWAAPAVCQIVCKMGMANDTA